MTAMGYEMRCLEGAEPPEKKAFLHTFIARYIICYHKYLYATRGCAIPVTPPILSLDTPCLPSSLNHSQSCMWKWSEEYGDPFTLTMFGQKYVCLNKEDRIHDALLYRGEIILL